MTKDFSVLISIYRKENLLWFREALDSVFAQTIQPAEIVLVEDGPLTPELYAIIDDYSRKHPIFNIVKNETNLGLGLALRNGVLAAKYDILARMDTDDIIPTHRFATQLAKIEEGYDVVSCWSTLFLNEKDNIIAVKTRPEHHDDIVKLAHKRSPVCHAAVFMRKSAVLEAGNYMHRQYYEDYNLWVRMILKGARFYNVQESLYDVRTTQAQLNRRAGFSYLKNELKYLKEFYTLGFYSLGDLIKNSAIRIVARLMPNGMREFAFKKIWNYKSAK
ncbi:glycosyltransferase [Bacteroides pyogenes]|uniref:glycosyltransferase n=1 Tax=Bacteroides pyogenes TaxID=310300 RepID=UPI003B429C1F